MTELPRWRCHKVVSAAKILEIERRSGGALLALEGEAIEGVSSVYMGKHDPQVGGYYVRYDDGYESFSPAEAFEAGYMRVEEGENSAEAEIDRLLGALELAWGIIAEADGSDQWRSEARTFQDVWLTFSKRLRPAKTPVPRPAWVGEPPMSDELIERYRASAELSAPKAYGWTTEEVRALLAMIDWLRGKT